MVQHSRDARADYVAILAEARADQPALLEHDIRIGTRSTPESVGGGLASCRV